MVSTITVRLDLLWRVLVDDVGDMINRARVVEWVNNGDEVFETGEYGLELYDLVST